MSNVIQIVELHLSENGFDGLFSPIQDCACKLGELALCENIGIECKPGYLGPCNCAEGDDTHHFHINAEKMK